ncbi:peptidoglycan bridge formation glycyltransferase FemA/FemB family protein [Kocuria sp.]|uniref:lipid II:glycine glycyltransferase FemX n=1 Tax=Kocuria sp. TaxID=1871328 RepID=UPI0028121AA9|nr:peptidoglycan bridge formation glycyltransferase FemA/FemB family protein [Kocuria sp.]HST73341.1 peptidoglycan bridge formation glycyltransferase FemA/FemB family protein [Kocuria rosea]
MANILQSKAWASFQRNLGRTVVEAAGDGWRYLAVVEGGRTGRYLYCPYGPEAQSPQAFDAALADLARAAREHRCWFVRVEPAGAAVTDGLETPEASLRRRGLRPAPRQVQPGHTQVIDLTRDEDAILKDMKSTNRNLHRNIAKKGVTFTSSAEPGDVDVLLRFLDATAERKDFNRQQDDYLREAARTLMPLGAARLYVARLEGEPIGAALAYDSDDTRTYAHAAMDFEHRRLSAGIPLVVRMVLDAKAAGLSRFDLFGTAPEGAGPEHEWYGFTKFKKSFGGRPESYPGTWDLPVSRTGYTAYTGVRAARERVAAARRALPGLAARIRPGVRPGAGGTGRDDA